MKRTTHTTNTKLISPCDNKSNMTLSLVKIYNKILRAAHKGQSASNLMLPPHFVRFSPVRTFRQTSAVFFKKGHNTFLSREATNIICC